MIVGLHDQQSDVERVKEHWGKTAATWGIGNGIHWTEHVTVQQRINYLVSGRVDHDPYQYLIEFLKGRGRSLPLARCLTLGCGAGELERGLSRYHFSCRYDACDIAEGAIEKAKRAAEAQGLTDIHYQVCDANQLSLPADAYDVIFGVMSIHHLSNLEHIFREVKRSLKKDGVLFLNEFIGPTKFQWTDRQIEIINGLLQVLPPRYRMTKQNRLKPPVARPTIAEMDAVDPSEAVRSAEILNILSSCFTIREKRDYGGTLLHLLLEGIVFNFDPDNATDARVFKMIVDTEDRLLEVGDITSDFSVIIAQ